MFNKKSKEPWKKPFSEKVATRISKIPTGELSLWVDQAMYDLGRCLNQYERSRNVTFLNEALTGAEAIHAVVDELHSRMTKV
jgi:hypothetical protein